MQLCGGEGLITLSGGSTRSTSRSAPEVNGLFGSIRYLSAIATAVLAVGQGQLMAELLAGDEPLRSNSARPPRLTTRTRTTEPPSARMPSLSSHSSPSYTPSGSAASALRMVSAEASQAYLIPPTYAS